MELFNAQHVLHGEPVTGELPSTNSLFKTTINMAWPSMVESFLVALVGFIDTIMVSTLGSYAIAAVGLTQQPKFIGLALFMSMSTAISALVARRRGEQNRESAVRILKTPLRDGNRQLDVYSRCRTVCGAGLYHLPRHDGRAIPLGMAALGAVRAESASL